MHKTIGQKIYKALFVVVCVIAALVLLLFEMYRETGEPLQVYETTNPYIVGEGQTLISAHPGVLQLRIKKSVMKAGGRLIFLSNIFI